MRVTPQDKKEVCKVSKALKKLCNQFLLEDDNRLLFEQYIKDFKISDVVWTHSDERLYGALRFKSISAMLARLGMDGELINAFLTIVCKGSDFDFWHSEVMGIIAHYTSVKKRFMKKEKLGSLASLSGHGWRVLTRKDLCLVDTCFLHFIKRTDGTGICWYWM